MTGPPTFGPPHADPDDTIDSEAIASWVDVGQTPWHEYQQFHRPLRELAEFRNGQIVIRDPFAALRPEDV